MKITELDENLKNNGIPRNWYSINEGLDEHYCIDEKGILKKKWEVYYSERGNKVNLSIFELEQEACEYFLKLIYERYASYMSRKT